MQESILEPLVYRLATNPVTVPAPEVIKNFNAQVATQLSMRVILLIR